MYYYYYYIIFQWWITKDKDQEQFTKQLLYYLGGFAVGIPVSTQIAAFSH